MSRPAPLAAATLAQASMELRLTARRGENVLVTIVIPVVVLLFFATVGIVPTGAARPGRLPPAGRARSGGHRHEPRQPRDRHRVRAELRRPQAARRVAADPRRAADGQDGHGPRRRGRPGRAAGRDRRRPFLGWSAGPGASVAVFVAEPCCSGPPRSPVSACSSPEHSGRRPRSRSRTACSSRSCCSVGSCIPVSHLPEPLATIASWLPAAALADAFRVALGSGAGDDLTRSLAVLAVWAVVTVGLAVRTFRWE